MTGPVVAVLGAWLSVLIRIGPGSLIVGLDHARGIHYERGIHCARNTQLENSIVNCTCYTRHVCETAYATALGSLAEKQERSLFFCDSRAYILLYNHIVNYKKIM